MNKINKIILSALLACLTSNSASIEDDPYYKHTGGSSGSSCIAGDECYGASCSSEAPEFPISKYTEQSIFSNSVVATTRDKALKCTLYNYFLKFKLCQTKYYKLTALKNMLSKSDFTSYIEYKNFILDCFSRFVSIRDIYYSPFSHLILSELTYNEINTSFSNMNFLRKMPQKYSLKFNKMLNRTSINTIHVINPDSCSYKIVDELLLALNSNKMDDIAKIILNPDLPVDLFPTVTKKLIEEYRNLHNFGAAFENDSEIDVFLKAYQENPYHSRDVANLRASSKGINGK